MKMKCIILLPGVLILLSFYCSAQGIAVSPASIGIDLDSGNSGKRVFIYNYGSEEVSYMTVADSALLSTSSNGGLLLPGEFDSVLVTASPAESDYDSFLLVEPIIGSSGSVDVGVGAAVRVYVRQAVIPSGNLLPGLGIMTGTVFLGLMSYFFVKDRRHKIINRPALTITDG